jgi:hypothetical protein
MPFRINPSIYEEFNNIRIEKFISPRIYYKMQILTKNNLIYNELVKEL